MFPQPVHAIVYPVREGMTPGKILVGTCGYSYEDWGDVFYPDTLAKDAYLNYYSLFFPFVELDFSWYAMPKPEALARMAGRTGSGFSFAIKAHRSLTHDRGPDWKDHAAEFARAAETLAVREKLATILIQLPFGFSYNDDNRRYLAALLGELESLPLSVEFRNDAWYSERVFEGLARRSVALVLVDRPDLPGLPPETATVTSSMAYLRFHGRNSGQWWTGDATGRYDYLYTEEELALRVPRIRELAAKASTVLVAFNNHAKGKAVANAKSLGDMLKRDAEYGKTPVTSRAG